MTSARRTLRPSVAFDTPRAAVYNRRTPYAGPTWRWCVT